MINVRVATTAGEITLPIPRFCVSCFSSLHNSPRVTLFSDTDVIVGRNNTLLAQCLSEKVSRVALTLRYDEPSKTLRARVSSSNPLRLARATQEALMLPKGTDTQLFNGDRVYLQCNQSSQSGAFEMSVHIGDSESGEMMCTPTLSQPSEVDVEKAAPANSTVAMTSPAPSQVAEPSPVDQFLGKNGFTEFIPAFQRELIVDLVDLADLQGNDLDKLGLHQIGLQKRFMRAVAALATDTNLRGSSTAATAPVGVPPKDKEEAIDVDAFGNQDEQQEQQGVQPMDVEIAVDVEPKAHIPLLLHVPCSECSKRMACFACDACYASVIDLVDDEKDDAIKGRILCFQCFHDIHTFDGDELHTPLCINGPLRIEQQTGNC
jgi:hypothetical protein